MIYYVDAYNLLFYLEEKGLLSHQAFTDLRNSFIEKMHSLAQQCQIKLYLIFDGNAYYPTHLTHLYKEKFFKVIYTEKGMSADDYIVYLIEQNQKKSCVLVTSDKQLIKRLNFLHVKTLSNEEFLSLKKTPAEKNAAQGHVFPKKHYLFQYYLNIFESKLLEEKDLDE